MQYDFTSIIDRKGKDAVAVDAVGTMPGLVPGTPRDGFSVIPMWVADMNFATVPTIQEAMIERAKHPCFGYFFPREEYYDAIITWQKNRNGVEGLTKDDIGYENGVLGCVVAAAEAFSAPGEPILVHSPTYIGFTMSMENIGRKLIHSPLKLDEHGVWRMDYEDMDKKIKENKIHFAIFCSPHNPSGRVWTREEIEQAMEVYRRNDVVVVSDEIWSDIILGENKHIPTQSVNEDARNRTIAVYAPSKTFNLAGLVGSYHIIYNTYLRDRVRRQSEMTHYNSMNVLSMHALMGAYKPEGEEWVDQLCQVLTDNVYYAYEYFQTHFPTVQVARPQGTYMLFLDFQEYCAQTGKTVDEILHAGWDVGVGWQDGRPFQNPWAIRMNLAVPHSQVIEAMDRLKDHVL